MLWKTGIAIGIAARTNHMHCKRSVKHTISWNPPLILEVKVKDVLVTVVVMLEFEWLQCELLLSSSGWMIEMQANDVPTSTVLLCCGYFLGLDVVTACAASKNLEEVSWMLGLQLWSGAVCSPWMQTASWASTSLPWLLTLSFCDEVLLLRGNFVVVYKWCLQNPK